MNAPNRVPVRCPNCDCSLHDDTSGPLPLGIVVGRNTTRLLCPFCAARIDLQPVTR